MQNYENRAEGSDARYYDSGTSLDTLEITSDLVPETLDFTGIGKASEGNLLRRNASKHFSGALMMRLCQLESPLESRYRDTYYCSHQLLVDHTHKAVKAKFCKRRWCVVCNRIRTADLITKYMPTLDSWEDRQFVTLTIKNMAAPEMGKALTKMLTDFVKIKDNLRKNYNTKLVGVRKLEITYNRAANEYHPHFHLITSENNNAQIIESWLRLNPAASIAAQDGRPADINSCFELFKYFTKLTSNSSKDKTITAEAIDTIFQEVIGRRTFQSFGFIPKKEMTEDELEKSGAVKFIINDYYKWEETVKTWVSPEGELAVNYVPDQRTIERTKNIRTWIKNPEQDARI